MKKIMMGTLLSIISMSCHAQFYVGLATGPEWADFKQKSITKSPGKFNAIDRTHLSGKGVLGSVFTGYGWNYNSFYLAGQLDANVSSVSYDNSNTETLHGATQSSKYKVQYSFSASILPGWQITDATLLYLRCGYTNGNFKINTNDVSLQNINKHLNGVNYGIGIKQAIFKRFSAILEYNRVTYQNTTLKAVDGLVSKSTRISPETNQFKIGLVYHFA